MKPSHPKKEKTPIVISLGGSIMCPSGPDHDAIAKFCAFARNTSKRHRLIVIVGGGGVCRTYQDVAKQFGADNESLDWIGIMATRLNAQLIATALKDLCIDPVVTDPNGPIQFRGIVLVGAGWKPGFSTDQDSVLLAKRFGATTILNLTNQDHVHTKDPKKHKDARPIDRITWKEYIRLIAGAWEPGLSTPFDPVASRTAQAEKMTVHIINGNHLDRVENAIRGKPHLGTTIEADS